MAAPSISWRPRPAVQSTVKVPMREPSMPLETPAEVAAPARLTRTHEGDSRFSGSRVARPYGTRRAAPR